HSGPDSDNLFVHPGQLHQLMAKDILVSRWLNRLVFFPGNLAGDLIKLARRMPGCCVAVLCRTVALALHRNAMKNLRPLDALEVVQNGDQVIDIMTIDRSEIPEVQRFKEVALAEERCLDSVLYLRYDLLGVLTELRQLPKKIPNFVLEFIVRPRRRDVDEIILQRANVGIDRHAVIVEHDKQIRIRYTRVVKSFKCNTSRKRAVTNYGDMVTIIFILVLGGDGHSQCG